MKEDELDNLFQKFLNRKPNNKETTWHLNKGLTEFENELFGCDEYKELQQRKKTNPHRKIAILLSGHIRNSIILKSIENKFQPYDYDIFVHTWDNYGVKSTETNLNAETQPNQIEEKIKKIPNLKKFLIENNKNFINSLEPLTCEMVNYSSPEEFIRSQLYSIHKSNELMKEYKFENDIKYDLVIKLRFDLLIENVLINENTLFKINNHNLIFTSSDNSSHAHPDSLSGPGCMVCNKMYYDHGILDKHVFDHSNVICDLYAYGSEKTMNQYCSMFINYESILKKFEIENKNNVEKYKNKLIKKGNVYHVRGILSDDEAHYYALYLFKSSFPESILKEILKDYIVVKSKDIIVKFSR